MEQKGRIGKGDHRREGWEKKGEIKWENEKYTMVK